MGVDRTVQRILNNGDTLVGNLVKLLGGWQGDKIVIRPNTNPDRIINISGESKFGQMATVAMSAFTDPPIGQNLEFPAIAGPLTARIEFGNGAQFTTVEVDVPIGANLDTLNAIINPAQVSNPNAVEGGTLVSLPSGVLRVYGRNDSNLVTPSLQFHGTQFGMPTGFPNSQIGFGETNIPRGMGPWWAGPIFSGGAEIDTTVPQTLPIPGNMKASVAYFQKSSGIRSRNTKTVWIYNCQPSDGGGGTNNAQIITSDNLPALYFVPPFAKSVRVWRETTSEAGTIGGPSAAVDVYIYDQLLNPRFPMDLFSIAGGVNGADIELPMTAVAVGVLTQAVVTSCALVFEIGI